MADRNLTSRSSAFVNMPTRISGCPAPSPASYIISSA